jgi:hypothetical protein
MKRSEREELERRVQDLDREHPDWSARDIETELRARLPVAYGNWADETPSEGSRRRSIQRWRGAGGRVLAARQAQALFPYAWPLGERQRHELEPAYTPSTRIVTGSWRLFLYNCGPEVLREVHVRLDGSSVEYSPFLAMGKFAEIRWQRVTSIKEAVMRFEGTSWSTHVLECDFVVAKGTKSARIRGTLRLDSGHGWVEFDAGDGRTKEIE